VAKQDERGEVVDFHALRTMFVSNLARSGVHPKVAQTLARHSDFKLTMDVYTRVNLDDQVQAIAGLPSLVPSLVSEGDQARTSVTSDGPNSDSCSPKEHAPETTPSGVENAENQVLACASADLKDGAPTRTRTWDPRIRNPVLYPAELWARPGTL